jgi:thiamine transporter
MPAGGTVSLEMLPILVLGLRRGPVAGLAAGALYGVVDYFMEPFFVHWVQLFLDYPLAFALVGGLAGVWTPLWRRLMATGRTAIAVSWVVPAAVVLASLGRYAAHFASGVVFFATAVMGGPLADGQSPFSNAGALGAAAAYSAIYNLYVPISAAACLAAMLVLMPVLEKAVPPR